MNGWICLHRELIEKPIWKLSTPEQKSILITLLLMVNHKGNEWEWKGKKYVVSPGQVITSLEKIAKQSGRGISTQNVRTALKRFEKLEFLTNESTESGRLITIVNYTVYQDNENKPNKVTNKDLTNHQQTTNKPLTPNNNDNNDNNDNNIYPTTTAAESETAETFQILEKCGFRFDGFTADRIMSLIDDFSAVWVQEAIKRAATRGNRRLDYVEGILNKWQIHGAIDDGNGGGHEDKRRNTRFEEKGGRSTEKDYSDGNGLSFD